MFYCAEMEGFPWGQTSLAMQSQSTPTPSPTLTASHKIHTQPHPFTLIYSLSFALDLFSLHFAGMLDCDVAAGSHNMGTEGEF